MYVADKATRTALTERLRAALGSDPRLAIDTEFIRERSYAPVLEVVQVATADNFVAVLDMSALGGDLGPLRELLLDPSVLKIFHAGGQDLEILGGRLGALPAPVYDTQIAASFAGWGAQIGYGALVQALLDVRLSKEEGFADWSRRPLTPAMLAYAENDVRYLLALHERLDRFLQERGRAAWAREQMQRFLGSAAQSEVAPEELWRRVGGRSALDPKGLAILRELALWRDQEAQRRDKPRRTVLKDEILVEVARRAPKTATAVLMLRGIPQSMGAATAAALAERVHRGLAVPEKDRPRVESAPPLDEQGAALVELLSAVVRVRAGEEDLPPFLLATQEELRVIAANRPSLAGPLFTGWRGELIGNVLRDVLAGRLAALWDAGQGRLRLVPPAEEPPPA